MGRGGVLVIRWTLPSGTEIDSGFRADDKAVYPPWIAEFTATPADSETPAHVETLTDSEQGKDQ